MTFVKENVVFLLDLNSFELKSFKFSNIKFKQCFLSYNENYLILYSPNSSEFYIFEVENLKENTINFEPVKLLIEEPFRKFSRIFGLNNQFFIVYPDGLVEKFNLEDTKLSKVFSLPHFINDEIFNCNYNQEIIYLKTGTFSFYFANLSSQKLLDHHLSGITEISNNQQFILNIHFCDFTLLNYNLDEILFQETIPYEIIFGIFDYDSNFIIIVIEDFILCYSIQLKKLIFCILISTKDIKSIFVSKSNDLFLIKLDGEIFKFEIFKLQTKIKMKKRMEGKLQDIYFKCK